MELQVRRVYEPPSRYDGRRILVDRIWPRGLTKAGARLDDWARDVAPSTDLRRWYGHDPARYPEFTRRYARELTDPVRHAALHRLAAAATRGRVTLLTATRDIDHSHATYLAGVIRHAATAPSRR